MKSIVKVCSANCTSKSVPASTLAELAKEQRKFAQIRKNDADVSSDAESIEIEKEATAISFLEFLKKARTGEAIPPDVIIKFAKYFEDNLTLDNMGRMQLINMCKYMGITLSTERNGIVSASSSI